MKILGEKSLSSKVEHGLQAIFIIIALIDFAVLAIFITVVISEFSRKSITNILQPISLTVALGIFLATGLVALYIISKFIKIFKNLKENKLFDNTNSNHLNKISISSIIIGILYFAIMLSLMYYIKSLAINVEVIILCSLILGTFSIAFILLGIGIKILNEIYKKAIVYKEDNDLTV